MTGFAHIGDTEIANMERIRVVRGPFTAPDGSTFERDIVRNLAVLAVVPLVDNGRSAILVRQYRGPIDRDLLEIPAGLCDVEGEDRMETAKRELAEEIGRAAGHLELVAGFYPAAGFSDQHVSVYLATELTEVPVDRHGPEEAHMTVETIALADVPALIADGTLRDSKTIIGLLLARELSGR